jgi:hypothetical protein
MIHYFMYEQVIAKWQGKFHYYMDAQLSPNNKLPEVGNVLNCKSRWQSSIRMCNNFDVACKLSNFLFFSN